MLPTLPFPDFISAPDLSVSDSSKLIPDLSDSPEFLARISPVSFRSTEWVYLENKSDSVTIEGVMTESGKNKNKTKYCTGV